MSVTGVEGTSYRGLLQRTLLNGVLVYPEKGGKYRAKGCMSLE